MQTHAASGASPQLAPVALIPSISNFARRLWAAVGTYYVARLDAYAAAAMYEQLSRLSDAELSRRGMTKSDLHGHVFERMTTRP
jgi:hypothetical protein